MDSRDDHPGLTLGNTRPDAGTLNNLRSEVGWNLLDPGVLEAALENSLEVFTIYEETTLAGFCRLVGDGVQVYVEELIINPSYQGHGLGTWMMEEVLDYIRHRCPASCRVGLFANEGLEVFYGQFGFVRRNRSIPAMELRPGA